MKMNAGSLYRDYLVLYAKDVDPVCIQVTNQEIQWDIYCNDVEVELENDKTAKVIYKDLEFHFPYIQTSDPMKTLGFSG